jgi:hypothetical protein
MNDRRVLAMCLLISASCAQQPDDSLNQTDQAVVTNPSTGGPYGSGVTSSPTPTTAVAGFMDAAAKNWGCDWNLAAHPIVDLGNGNYSKSYGTLASPASGCGVVYWNASKNAAFFMQVGDGGANVALSALGAMAFATSTLAGTSPAAANNGDRSGNDKLGAEWASASPVNSHAPQTLTIQLDALRTIDSIEVVTHQDAILGRTSEPTLATTFTTAGIQTFTLAALVGTTWQSVASVTGNNHVVVARSFAPIAATAIRVTVTQAAGGYARIVELSAHDATTPTSSPALYTRYAALGAATSPLGLPISNPVPFVGNAVTYQLFDNGVMTYQRGDAAAFFVGGTIHDAATGLTFDDRPLAAAWQRLFDAYPTSMGSPITYPLTSDARCATTTGSPTACSITTTGRFATYADTWWGGTGYVLGELGQPNAYNVSVPVAEDLKLTAAYPWLHALGYPTSDMAGVGGSTLYLEQSFEHGTEVFVPGYSLGGVASACPSPIANCSGGPGVTGCPQQYGSRWTNYVVKENVPAFSSTCSTYVTPPHNPLQPSAGTLAYYIPPGSSQDFPLGTYQAGTTLEFGNCDGPQSTTGVSLSIYNNGVVVPLPLTGACANGAAGKVYATFSSRTGTEQWTARLTCASGASATACTSVARFTTRYDFNGDLTRVFQAWFNIPTSTSSASIFGLLDQNGEFDDSYYGCSLHEDHPEGIVRLQNNHFVVTADFGTNGKLYMFDMRSKPNDNLHRLGSNIDGNGPPPDDSMIATNFDIGQGRGHLGGASRSGDFVLTAAEVDTNDFDDFFGDDNASSTSGMINVIKARGEQLDDVNHYTNVDKLGHDDGAAWVTSAKLGEGSTNPADPNFIPLELRNTHFILSAGTNMLTINAVFAARDGGGLSTLDSQDPKLAGANFAKFTSVATPPPADVRANQASLITQTDGEVFLLTLDDASGSSDGVGRLFKVSFSNCPDKAAKLCFIELSEHRFLTASIVDMKRAAGTYIAATGDPSTEGIFVYALWPTKVSNTHDDGCPDGRGPYLRGMEF